MREIPRLCRFAASYFFLLFIAAGIPELNAQTEAHSLPSKSSAPEQPSQIELLESYRSLREQLRATQTAIVNNRFEAEATARAQAAVLAEKIEAMNTTLAAERKIRQEETDRFEFEREQQRLEIQRSNRSIIWVACAFGLAGLSAMVSAALFQWRAINRMADVVSLYPQLPAPGDSTMPPSSVSLVASQAMALSTQRLMSTMDRMEKRIKELELTNSQPLPTASIKTATASGRTQETAI